VISQENEPPIDFCFDQPVNDAFYWQVLLAAAPFNPWLASVVSVRGLVKGRRAGQTQWQVARLIRIVWVTRKIVMSVLVSPCRD